MARPPRRDVLPARALPEVTGLLDCYSEPAILLAPDHRILAANRAYREAYGEGQPLHARRCYQVSHHYEVPCDQAGESCPLQASLASGARERALHLHHTPQGEEHVDVEMHPVRDAEGRIVYFVELLRRSTMASARPGGQALVGRSAAFNRMLELVARVAAAETAVLLLGESGTGKELVARAIHEASPRGRGPFVPVECSGLTETLFESELFGYEKGAFTGAHFRKTGLIEAARGGTLFLDEIGDIPLPLQVKLLRLLETRTFRRVGGVEPQEADFRLVCATHRDLKRMVAEGGFRADLYYRISAFPIALPALRDRPEDLPLLVEAQLARLHPERRIQVSAAALACLGAYAFPGNVRELRNVLERASLLADDEVIQPRHLPDEIRCAPGEAAGEADLLPLEAAEARYLRQALARFKGDRRALAAKLGISERTLYRKLKRSE